QRADLSLVSELEGLYAAADEKHDPANCPVEPGRLRQRKGIEVGHIFYFGTKYSAPMGASVASPSGEMVPVDMGSYGIGVSRLVGAIIEASHDDNGIVWPASVAPYQVALINLRAADAECTAAADGLYERFMNAGVETLYDDRDERPGVKFADADLIGLPWQVVIGPRGVKAGVVEFKDRATGQTEELSADAALNRLAGA
ncbi:MAG: proline--tRNA ligase, partial [Alphaproteobacteria bacterium]|nr:proline--tRNA ligase [Alphaproteobacteria bacterium]